jgi:two-component system phosphate regulon sensor histidine kinase PhoR
MIFNWLKRKSDLPSAEKPAEHDDNRKRIDTFRKEFMGNVYHELKTPVFNLQGYILTLLDGGLEDPSINRLYLERSAKNINRMISIVEDLETISRLETETIALKREKFDLRRMVEEVFDASEVRASRRRIRLTIATPGSGEMMVMADRKRIYQVINNLVINSINYGTEGGFTKVWMTAGPKKMLVEVEDNGIGIAENDQQRIFERFYRVDRSRSRDSGGTGLGLAIVKHIVEAHGHTVKVKSTPGKGTTFSFTLDR